MDRKKELQTTNSYISKLLDKLNKYHQKNSKNISNNITFSDTDRADMIARELENICLTVGILKEEDGIYF